MTILHSINSSRHAVTPDPESGMWPAGTQHTSDDILIRGASLATAARDGRTPVVRIGAVPGQPGARAERQGFVTVLVTRVEHVDHLGVLQRPDIWIDAALGGCEPILAAARIIGRPTTERLKKHRMLTESDPGTHRDVKLPGDVCAGDLVAIPCVGTVPRNQVTSHQYSRHVVSAETPDDPLEDTGYYGMCGK